MNAFRLVRLIGGQERHSWPLSPNGSTLLGKQQQGQDGALIDLSPDATVSRRHACLTFEKNAWWIEDLESTWGTFVDGKAISDEPIELKPWSRIILGATVLMVVPPDGHWLRKQALVVGLEVNATLNYALVRAAGACLPFIPRLGVYHGGTQPSSLAVLRLALAPYGRAKEISVPSLQPGQWQLLPVPEFQFDPQAFDAPASRPVCLSVTLNGEVLEGDIITCEVLQPNVWSMADAPFHQRSLAAFVQRNHPLIALLTAHACCHLSADAGPVDVLQAVYEYLFEHWHVQYEKEPAYDPGRPEQLVRLPHDVLFGFREGSACREEESPTSNGLGTCLDLALVIAACLELRNHYPLIALCLEGSGRHVLVGCRKTSNPGLRPLLTDLEARGRRLLNAVEWVDPNGCTRKKEYRKDFQHACEWAREYLQEKGTFLFALDVFAARAKGVRPLPLASTPRPAPAYRQALETTAQAARQYRRSLSSVLLFYGLLMLENGAVQQVLDKRGISPEAAQVKLEAFILDKIPEGDPKEPREHFEKALAAAPGLAKRDGSNVVLDSHLLCALLEADAQALTEALKHIGLSMKEMHQTVCRDLGRDPLFATTFLGDS